MEVKLKLKPFTTPNFAMVEMPPRPREEGMKELPSLALETLDAETLEALCIQFRADIFKKAGKTDPEHTRPQPAYCNCGGVK